MNKEINLGNLIIPVIKPQKGKDYYTESEKQELISIVTDNVNAGVLPQEQTRQSNEIIRQNNEQTRQAQETIRQTNETNRQTAETERESAENTRQSNESSRVSAEQTRTQTFNNKMDEVDTAIAGIHTSQNAYDQNATAKTSAFNENATSKTSDYNTNATNKTAEYNENASTKIAEYDAHIRDYEAELATKVDKVIGKGLSSNDFTNEEKAKLAELHNYDDTELSERVDDIEQEQTTQNTNISTNATNIESLQEENENLKKIVSQLPQVQGQGTSITLENTIEAQFTKFDVEGNSTQESTKGYQLLNPADFSDSLTNNGITFTNNGDGSITINGTSTGTTMIQLDKIKKTLKAGKYTFSLTNGIKDKLYMIWSAPYNSTNTIGTDMLYKEVTFDSDTELAYIYIQIPSGYTFNNVVVYPMIYEGSYDSSKPWEKYTNGASPNPNYEQPIYSAGDNGSINEKIQTRNWFDVSKISQLIKNGTTTSDGITNIDNVITINKTNGQHGSYAMNYLMPIKSGKITVSFKALVSGTHSNTGILVALYNSTATIYATTAQTKYASSKDKWLDYNATFELNQEAIDGIHLDIQAANTGNVIQIKDIQVELGSTASPYVEHQDQDYSIFVQQPMRSIGDVRDCFVQKDGNWFERHYIGEKILNGTENWEIYNTHIYLYDDTFKASVESNDYVPNYKCNYFIPDSLLNANSSPNGKILQNTWGVLEKHKGIAFNSQDAFSDVATLKTWLTSHNTKLQYELAEPLDLPCTETQIQQLENLPSTYKDFTIIQSQDETPAYLEVSGIRDIDTMFDKVTNAIVSLGGNV